MLAIEGQDYFQSRLDTLVVRMAAPRALVSKHREQTLHLARALIETLTYITSEDDVTVEKVIYVNNAEVEHAIQRHHNVIGEERPPPDQT